MTRPVRIEFEGALYHVTSRGDRREAIYEDDADREQFLEILGETIATFNWACHAYCLMGNRYHPVIEIPDGNLSKGMRPRKTWTDLFFILLPRAALRSVFDPAPDNRFDLIDKSRVPSQFSALRRLPDQVPLAGRHPGPNELPIALFTFSIRFRKRLIAWIRIKPMVGAGDAGVLPMT